MLNPEAQAEVCSSFQTLFKILVERPALIAVVQMSHALMEKSSNGLRAAEERAQMKAREAKYPDPAIELAQLEAQRRAA